MLGLGTVALVCEFASCMYVSPCYVVVPVVILLKLRPQWNSVKCASCRG